MNTRTEKPVQTSWTLCRRYDIMSGLYQNLVNACQTFPIVSIAFYNRNKDHCKSVVCRSHMSLHFSGYFQIWRRQIKGFLGHFSMYLLKFQTFHSHKQPNTFHSYCVNTVWTTYDCWRVHSFSYMLIISTNYTFDYFSTNIYSKYHLLDCWCVELMIYFTENDMLSSVSI